MPGDVSPGDDEVLASLRRANSGDGDEAALQLDAELIGIAQSAPSALARVATQTLSTGDAQLRMTAIYALGRAAEAGDPSLVAQIERTLVGRAELDHALERKALATALLHVWSRDDDDTFTVERRSARHRSVALRMAAAMSLALSTPEPLPGFLVPELRELATDAHAEVRFWAKQALSGSDEAPPIRS